jgi:hypothetical protein
MMELVVGTSGLPLKHEGDPSCSEPDPNRSTSPCRPSLPSTSPQAPLPRERVRAWARSSRTRVRSLAKNGRATLSDRRPAAAICPFTSSLFDSAQAALRMTAPSIILSLKANGPGAFSPRPRIAVELCVRSERAHDVQVGVEAVRVSFPRDHREAGPTDRLRSMRRLADRIERGAGERAG